MKNNRFYLMKFIAVPFVALFGFIFIEIEGGKVGTNTPFY